MPTEKSMKDKLKPCITCQQASKLSSHCQITIIPAEYSVCHLFAKLVA